MIRKSTSIPRTYTDRDGLKHADLTERLIGIFFHVYDGLGHGFLESVYEQAFCHSLAQANVFFERQIAIPVWFEGQKIGDFRADLLAESESHRRV